ncbi:uncharacterized protein N7503_006792 [Penicillium pulvis]|uniref:uncharacterized protein n=1 Tax=Penicillium pulvis TaxID=1562058 RepID=UPI002547E671|nr:uncharacterized protein N7503_006792 [Penicillium pulvis]KAJ5797496.1 hypothetical protein N7503_006792 [Penicillium pulvis]
MEASATCLSCIYNQFDPYQSNNRLGQWCEANSAGGSSVSTVTSPSKASPTTTTSDGISTPLPIQSGMVSTCDQSYLVVSGDTCAAIASTYDITIDDFYAWNPAVGSSCASLWVDDYVCVAVNTS